MHLILRHTCLIHVLLDIDETVIMPFFYKWLSTDNDKIISTKFMLNIIKN